MTNRFKFLIGLLSALTLIAFALQGCKTRCNDCSDLSAPRIVDPTEYQQWTVDPKVHTNKINEVIR